MNHGSTKNIKEKEFRRTSPLTVYDKFHSLFSGNLLEFLSNTDSQNFQYSQKPAFSKLISFFVFSNLLTINCIFLFSISVLDILSFIFYVAKHSTY